jgi:hypothetical protein
MRISPFRRHIGRCAPHGGKREARLCESCHVDSSGFAFPHRLLTASGEVFKNFF